MSTDTFEDELRSLLHDTADAEGPAYVDVDPNAVVTTGRRVVRRRRAVAGAGIAAAAVAARRVGRDRRASSAAAGRDTRRRPHGAGRASTPGLTAPSGADFVRSRLAVSRPRRRERHALAETTRSMLGGSTWSTRPPPRPGGRCDGSHVVVGVVPEQARGVLPANPGARR